MKVLVSPTNLEEARLLVDLGVDIIDVKNPAEGSLGAQTPRVIRQIAEHVNARGVPVSATLGDLPFKPGTAALAAFGLAHLGVKYVKAGLHGTRTRREAFELLSAVRDAVQMLDRGIAVVAAGYADYRAFEGLSPDDLVQAAAEAGCEFVMLDTAVKNGKTLFDAIDSSELQDFLDAGRAQRLKVALAGSIGLPHIPLLLALDPDLIGVRGALCSTSDRRRGIDPAIARKFIRAARATGAPVSRTFHMTE